MKQITILYFGLLREAAGCAEEHVSTEVTTAGELFDERAAIHGIQTAVENLKVARNEVFCSFNETLADGDVIAFMPPMAGG